MNQAIASPTLSAKESSIANAIQIPELHREEVIPMAREELNRFLALLEALSPDDWQKPTECTLWSVKDIVAHQGSHVYSLTRVGELLDQFNPLQALDYLKKGMSPLDAANQRQVDKRTNWTSAQLIAEIRDNSEKSLVERQRFPRLLRALATPPVPGTDKWIGIGYLLDNIYTRDMWMHRLDIAHATGREMLQNTGHDGRITALAMLDLAKTLAPKLKHRAIIYHLSGKAGGEWQIANAAAEARISLDTLVFHRIAACRITWEQALELGLVKIEGDESLAKLALANTIILY